MLTISRGMKLEWRLNICEEFPKNLIFSAIELKVVFIQQVNFGARPFNNVIQVSTDIINNLVNYKSHQFRK